MKEESRTPVEEINILKDQIAEASESIAYHKGQVNLHVKLLNACMMQNDYETVLSCGEKIVREARNMTRLENVLKIKKERLKNTEE